MNSAFAIILGSFIFFFANSASACKQDRGHWRVYHYGKKHFIGDNLYGFVDLSKCLDAQYSGRTIGNRQLICASYSAGASIFDGDTNFRYGSGYWHDVKSCVYALKWARGDFFCVPRNSLIQLVNANENIPLKLYSNVEQCVNDLWY